MSQRNVEMFKYDYLIYLKAKRDYPGLNHEKHDPTPDNYGISEFEAKLWRKKVEEDFYRVT